MHDPDPYARPRKQRRAKPPPEPGSFAYWLDLHRTRAGLSQNRLARMAGVDPSYINRQSTAKSPPSRFVVLRIVEAIGLGDAERDRLLRLAGHAPVEDWQTRAERAEAALLAIAATLEEAHEPLRPIREPRPPDQADALDWGHQQALLPDMRQGLPAHHGRG